MQELMVDVRRSMFDFVGSNSYPETTKNNHLACIEHFAGAGDHNGVVPLRLRECQELKAVDCTRQ